VRGAQALRRTGVVAGSATGMPRLAALLMRPGPGPGTGRMASVSNRSVL
jgi:hypothetical protein